ncbi:putative metalloprotease CJM1_0395 family protein [Chitinimonas sp.]|uniref:putative metalloprotease CJM1_0395 family protein n=1 Tax=Chitinimonas sp. TaxID=1934313 RepID=UPI002F931A3A
MNVSGTSGISSIYYASSSMRLHSPGCTCSLCSPARVDTSNPSADIQSQEGKTQLTQIGKQLTPEEEDQVEKLRARDREVRQHEQAHLTAAGGLTISGPSFSYQRGPDGVNYAIGGEVNIDTSPGKTPQETLRKAQQIERAALAPKDPSGPDRAVAARARQMLQEAQAQMAAEQHASGPDGAAATGKDAGSANAAGTVPDTGTDAGQNRAGSRAQQAYQAGQGQGAIYNLISAYA